MFFLMATLLAPPGQLGHCVTQIVKGEVMDSGLIALKAINGGQLTDAERAALTPSLLVQLVIGGYLVLTQAERDRIPAPELAQLAIGEYIELNAEEIRSLPDVLRLQLEIGGYIK